LLKNNIPLYLQYILARYFSADTGVEQLNWILEGQIAIDSLDVVTSLSRISLKEFNASVNFFPTSEMLRAFSNSVENIGLFYPFPQHCNGLIANMLLYFVDDSIAGSLKEAKRIGCIFEEAKGLVKMGFNLMDRTLSFDAGSSVGPLIHTLIKMRTIFGDCKVQSNGQEWRVGLPQTILVNYTSAEELWMKQKFDEFQREYISVSPPKEYFEELIHLLVHGKQVSETFVLSWMAMDTERVRRVLKMHPEFRNLSNRDQEMLWRKNHSSATALSCIRINLLKTGKDQFKHVIGVLDCANQTWEAKYNRYIDLDSLKSNYINRKEVNSGLWDEATIRCYFEIMKDLSKMCENVQVFQLFTLLTLLDTEGLPESPQLMEVMKTRQTYLKFFQRKLASAGCTFVDYAHFRRTLKKVKIFASLMENFLV
jgi:hypothetical protein